MMSDTDWQKLSRGTLRAIAERVMQKFAPPSRMTITEWANSYRFLASESSALPGKYSTDLTPWVPGIHEALDDPNIWKVIGMKAAQVAWTDGVINNWLGKIIDIDPTPVIGLFEKDGKAREYADEKLSPMVKSTQRLDEKMDVRTSRKDGNRALFKKFPGGFLKLVGSNSPGNVKSTPSPRVFVEEPDDVSVNVKSQGDSIKLLEERTKTFPRRKVVFGGTPSVKGISTIEDAFLTGDQRRFHVPCPDCDDSHVLNWENVKWEIDADYQHPVYGRSKPETAIYACPHCGSIWDDAKKNRAVRNGKWIASVPPSGNGIASFHISELYSPFPGSKLVRLVERYLEAQLKLEQGDETDMIVFVNSCLGLPYEYKSDAPALEALQDRAEDYPEDTIPDGGLILTAGVDVQHDRLAIIIRAWGRDEESWLVYWGEIYGNTIDKKDPVWSGLDHILFKPRRRANGGSLIISAAGIDSGDGTTSDAVYHYVRSRQARGVMAVKGDSADYGQREIFRKPAPSIDTKGQRNTKASTYGLRVYLVGTHKAKDLLAGRLKLTGHGAGRLHWYQSVRQDYYQQITAEVKAPHRTMRNRRVWQRKSGQPAEALDGEVYALHAARSRRVHLLKPEQWTALEQQLAQAPLFADAETHEELALASAEPAKAPAQAAAASGSVTNRQKTRRQAITRRSGL